MRVFPIIMLLLITGANVYVIFRLWQMIPAGTVIRPIALALGIAVASCLYLFFMADRISPMWLSSGIYRVGTAWFFILLYLLMIFLVADVLRLCGVKQLAGLMHSNWTAFLALAGIVSLIFIGGYINYSNKKRTEIRVAAEGYGGFSQPLRIVAVSDLHIGYGIGPRELSRWVDMINAEKPDAVVIAGDFIDNGVKPLYHHDIASVLGRIEARHGVFICLGNHEYITGIDKSMEFLSRTGMTILKDSVALLPNGLYIAGRDDMSNPRRKPLTDLLAGLDTGKPVLLLDHQPYNLEQAENAGVLMQFSGHTHRGQVWPINWITDRIYEDSYGYIRKGASHFYVSSGLGIWGGKFRLGSRSEYVVIDIVPESNSGK